MKEWFDNKTIAVVGNALSLFDKNYGKEIDDHDVVIRINKGIEVCLNESSFKSHGSKIDVWCFNIYSTLEKFERDVLKKINQPYKKLQTNFVELPTKFDSTISKKSQEEIQKLMVNRKATTGFRILYYITEFSAKSVDVYGFDWKKTRTYYETRRIFNNLNHELVTNRHDYDFEEKYCKNHFKKLHNYNFAD